MKHTSVAAAAITVALTLIVCGGAIGLPLLMASAEAGECAAGAAPPPDGSVPVGEWSPTAVANAAAIVTTGQKRNVPTWGWVVAVAVAMQETHLRNLANTTVPESLTLPHDGVGHDHDSVGLFQQRPGWGTVTERMTPTVSAGKFYTALTTVDGWQRMPLTQAAQAVQRSAFPQAYQKWQQPAQTLISALLKLPNLNTIGGAGPTAPCGPDAAGPVIVGAGGWTQPVRAPIVSRFRTPSRPTHDGVDLGAARNTVIRAASAGIVVWSGCDPGTRATVGTCDRDGSSTARGCGWYVDIWHPGNILTRYCHMIRRPYTAAGDTVTAGQVIGHVGTSGHSSGPHLHYEVHQHVGKGKYAGRNTATDPISFMTAVGAALP